MPPPMQIPGFYYDPERNRYFRRLVQHNAASLPSDRAKPKVLVGSAPDVVDSKRPRVHVSKLLACRQLGALAPSAQRSLVSYCVAHHLQAAKHHQVSLAWPNNVFMFMEKPAVLPVCESGSSVDGCKALFFSLNGHIFVVNGEDICPCPQEAFAPPCDWNPNFVERTQVMSWKPRSEESGHRHVSHLCRVRQHSGQNFVLEILRAVPRNTCSSNYSFSLANTLHFISNAGAIDLAWHPNDDAVYIAMGRSLSVFSDAGGLRDVASGCRRISRVRHMSDRNLLCAAYACGEMCVIDERLPAGTGHVLRRSAGKPIFIDDFCFLRDEQQMAVSSFDHRLELWDRRGGSSGCVVHSYSGHVNDGERGLGLAVHGTSLVAALGTDGLVRLWNVNTAASLSSVRIGRQPLSAACFPWWSPLADDPRASFSFFTCNLSSDGMKLQWFSPHL